MKKSIFIIAAQVALVILFFVVAISGCSNANTYSTPQDKKTSNYDTWKQRMVEKYDNTHMSLSDGRALSAAKGEFDGHTWYVFFYSFETPAVVHDPLCEKCAK